MATITLNPDESFEHYHLEESITKHVSGKIELSFNNEKILLNKGQKVIVPAKTSHITKNIGKDIASFSCEAHVVISTR
jgi:quercetin dioxygenase-like cupin family protein